MDLFLRRIHLPSVFLVTATGLAFFHTGHFSGLKAGLDSAVGMYVARQTLFYITAYMVLSAFPPNLGTIARYLAPAWALSTLWGAPPLWNAACNAAFLLCLLPFQRNLLSWCLVIYVGVLRVYEPSATPAFVLGAMGAACFLRYRFSGLVMATIAGIWALTHLYAFHETSRWDFYRTTWRFVQDTGVSFFWGTGLGSFPVIGPLICKLYSVPGERWLALHSDVLQVPLELGLFGAGILTLCVVQALRRLDFASYLSLVGLLAFGVFYFPMEIPMCLVWGMALVLEGNRERE